MSSAFSNRSLQSRRGKLLSVVRKVFARVRFVYVKLKKPKAAFASLRRRAKATRRRATGSLLPGPKTMADNIRYFANPGPDYEPPNALDSRTMQSRAKTVAFYLPQFHAFDENDEWWGDGFTEWRNVARGTPRFAGHFQPRVPRDLGFYDLSNVDVIRAQAELAKHNGIDAFCFYYYWFNGQRLMEKPLDLFLDSDIDQEFCIMWANENWTRTWDGLNSDVLIQQDYRDEDEDAFIADTARYMADSRYIHVSGKPLFILYRPGLLPNAADTIAQWRKKWLETLGVEPMVMMVQGFGQEDPREFGLDGAVEFPPHKVCAGLQNINDRCRILDSNYEGLVRDYNEVVEKSLKEVAPEFPLIKTVSPHWDNDARREGRGMVMHGSTPALYEKWLNGAIDFSVDNPVNNESLVFINAWNEWAEGAYLEPDVHYGHAYLNATKRAIKGLPGALDAGRILLVGHDAHRHGAQMLLFNIAKTCVQQFGMEVIIVLKSGGPMLAEYQKLAQTIVLKKQSAQQLTDLVERNNITTAICNTSVTGSLVPVLRLAGVRIVSLIHEMPNLIKDYDLENPVQDIARKANHVVFPADCVQHGFEKIAGKAQAEFVVRPQGTYSPVTFNEEIRQQERAKLGIRNDHKVVLGVGYADLRKGFDLFMDTARRLVKQHDDLHFIWAGALSGDMQRWIQTEFSEHPGSDRIHLVGFTDSVADFYSVADCFYLSSREDPYPTVVMEALNVGLPVLVYESATGFDQLMQRFGYLVEQGDSVALDAQLMMALTENDSQMKQARINHVEAECKFDDYCFDLLQLANPHLQRVSVAVPNYNYAQYLEQRLTSIFSQSYPVFEVTFVDDGSSDASLAVALRVARQAGRQIKVVRNQVNSGNVFHQWQQSCAVSRGDWLWVAEADDSATPMFLEKLVDSAQADTCMVFCDSAQIGVNSEHLSKSYRYYLDEISPSLFARDFIMPSQEFAAVAMATKNAILNVSSALFRKDLITDVLHELDEDLNEYTLVGDWRVYLALLLRENMSIAYIAESLNIHRRHQNSVTQSLDVQQHVNEIEAMHTYIQSEFGLDAESIDDMKQYVQALSAQLAEDVRELDRAA